jgi:hypothetical protein
LNAAGCDSSGLSNAVRAPTVALLAHLATARKALEKIEHLNRYRMGLAHQQQARYASDGHLLDSGRLR